MTSIVPVEEINTMLIMPQIDVNKMTAQMTALLSEMTEEKGRIDSMVTMLEKQPWYKRCINTITGKNKATVAEIQQHKDKIASYTSNALAVLYQNNRIGQEQIVFLGEAINSINGQLAATNYELLKTQAVVAEFKKEIVKSVADLANALNEKITSVDNFHMLITEIEQNTYESDNVLGTLFSVIAQIDRRMASDDRKMNILQNALTKKGYLNDTELPLMEYMKMVAKLSEDIAGTLFYEFYCLSGNDYADMFVDLINCYTFLPKMEKKSKKVELIIEKIFENHQIESDTAFSTNEIYEYFIEGKKDYLSSIKEVQVVETQEEVVVVESVGKEEIHDSTTDASVPNVQQDHVLSRKEEVNDNEIIIVGVKGSKKKDLRRLIKFALEEGYANSVDKPIFVIGTGDSANNEIDNSSKEIFNANRKMFEENGAVVFIDTSDAYQNSSISISLNLSSILARTALIDFSVYEPLFTHGNITAALNKLNKKTLGLWDDEMDSIRELIDVCSGKSDGQDYSIDSIVDDREEVTVTDIVDKYISDIARSGCTTYDSSEVLDVAREKSVNAKLTIGKFATGIPIGLADKSLFGNGKDGILFTEDGLAFDYLFEKVFVEYSNIYSLSFNKKGNELIIDCAYTGKKGFELGNLSIGDSFFDLSVLKQMLEEIMEIV